MQIVLKEFKDNKRVEYKSLPKSVISALIILWFGASLGPEAALSGIIGGIILVTADLIGRTMFAPVEVPIGIVTSIVGAPYFLYLLIRRKAIK